MNRTVKQHPTGAIGTVVSALIAVLAAVGVEISPELAAAIIGLVVAVASAFTPREP